MVGCDHDDVTCHLDDLLHAKRLARLEAAEVVAEPRRGSIASEIAPGFRERLRDDELRVITPEVQTPLDVTAVEGLEMGTHYSDVLHRRRLVECLAPSGRPAPSLPEND
jgi:hypothetical protein